MIVDNKQIDVIFSEVYDKGDAWIEMKIKIPGDVDQTLTFSSLDQFRQCVRLMADYYHTRQQDPLSGGVVPEDDDFLYAAEDPEDYGNV